jgi:hypothetical protein
MSARLAGRPALVAVAAILLGLLALGATVLFAGERQIEGKSNDAAVNAGAKDPGDISANNSPSLAQNPKDPDELAVSNRVDSPDYTCVLNTSRDHGRSWSAVQVKIPPGEGRKCFAPDVAYGADGTLYMSYVTLRGNGNVPARVWVARSTDNGKTLSAPVAVSGRLAFQVRLTADPDRAKRLYLTWLQTDDVGLLRFAGEDQRVVVSRSDDGGRTWGPPVRVSAPTRERPLAPSSAVGPDGELYVLYLDIGGDRLDYEAGHEGRGGEPYDGRFTLVLGRSADAGKTWQESVVDDDIVPTRRFIAFLPPTPSLAIDRSDGTIYAAFEDGGGSPSDVHVWSLQQDASDWEGPVRVNDTPRADRTSQYLPRIAVAPDGRVDVVYYDRRFDRMQDVMTDASIQSSADGAETFAPRVTLSTQSFDSRIGFGAERDMPDIGNRLGLVSEDDAALAVWADTRAGTPASLKADIAFAQAVVGTSGGLGDGARSALRVAGVILLLGGIALLVAARRRRA